MLKVLHTEWSKGWGGQEIRILLDARGLLERGYEVGVLCSPEGRLAREGAKFGVPIYLPNMRHSFDVSALQKIVSLIKKKVSQSLTPTVRLTAG